MLGSGNKERLGDQDGAKSKGFSCPDLGTPGLSPRLSFALATDYKKQRKLEVWPLLSSPTQEGSKNEMILIRCDKGVMNHSEHGIFTRTALLNPSLISLEKRCPDLGI